MQDPLNLYLYHPLSWQLARRLAHAGNAQHGFGGRGLFVVAAGFCYWGVPWPLGAALGMALHMTWHIVDGADGDLARVTGKSSPLGEMVDGICDYTSHIVLYVLLAFVLTRTMGAGWAWFWTLAAGASHIVQSNHVEVQRRFYQYWMYGVPWLHNAKGDQPGLFEEKRGAWRIFLQTIVRLYLRLAAGMSPHALVIDGAVKAARDDPARLAAIRAEVRREQQPLLRVLKLARTRARSCWAWRCLPAAPFTISCTRRWC
jgi:hypothetical protein